MEVFVDLDQPVLGEPSTWAIHLTHARLGTPHTDVTMRFKLTGPQGESETLKATLSKPGYASATWTPPSAGTWKVSWRESGNEEGVDLGALEVWSTADQEEAGHDDGGIAVTKEQVWVIPFGVAAARTDRFRPALHASGRWLAAPGDEVVQHATTSGVVRYADRPLVPGLGCAEGEALLYLEQGDMTDPGMAASRVAALSEFEAAESALERLKSLQAAGAATLTELQEAQRRFDVADEARARWERSANGQRIEVVAKRSGVIRDVLVAQGAFVQAGAPLLRMSTGQTALLELHVSPSWIPSIENWSRVDARLDGRWLACEVVSIGRVTMEGSGLVPVFLECPAAGQRPIAGSYAEVVIRHGEGREALVLPESCLMERYGMYEVAVQTGGEEYALKSVQVGERGAGEVEILGGLEPGELVVIEGGYAVRMTDMKGSTPAHGHTH